MESLRLAAPLVRSQIKVHASVLVGIGGAGCVRAVYFLSRSSTKSSGPLRLRRNRNHRFPTFRTSAFSFRLRSSPCLLFSCATPSQIERNCSLTLFCFSDPPSPYAPWGSCKQLRENVFAIKLYMNRVVDTRGAKRTTPIFQFFFLCKDQKRIAAAIPTMSSAPPNLSRLKVRWVCGE